MKKNKGKILIFSGAAGSGKGTVLSELMKMDPRFSYSVSMTSRKPRPGEKNAVHYFFVTREEFERRIEEGAFLEWAKYVDNYYGTPKDYVMESCDKGQIVILEIETQGAMKVMSALDEYISVFLSPPTFTKLGERLRGRATESEEVVRERLETAKKEIRCSEFYDHIVINPDGRAIDAARAVLALVTGEGEYDKTLVPGGSEEFINNFFDDRGEIK